MLVFGMLIVQSFLRSPFQSILTCVLVKYIIHWRETIILLLLFQNRKLNVGSDAYFEISCDGPFSFMNHYFQRWVKWYFWFCVESLEAYCCKFVCLYVRYAPVDRVVSLVVGPAY